MPLKTLYEYPIFANWPHKKRNSTYFTDEVYLQPQMKYIFYRSCSISSFSKEEYWLNADMHKNLLTQKLKNLSALQTVYCLANIGKDTVHRA